MSAEEKPKYSIISNRNQRQILVVNDVVDIENDPMIQYEDFDAIFLDVADNLLARNVMALHMVSPIHSEKCRFKPFFVSRRLEGWLRETSAIVDAYAVSPLDSVVTQTIEDILSNMMRLNFMVGTPPVMSHFEEMMRVLRFAISRGQYTFTSHPVFGLATGATNLYMNTMWYPQQEIIQARERQFLGSELLRMGYVRVSRYLEKVHLCPNCGRSHLLFFETCPKCQSSHIKEESVIHHFRCANVSPESSYEHDGELVCPKCKRYLRHIGVDYDRPSTIYTCKDCGEAFMYPDMRVRCANCKSVMTTSDLKAIDVMEYEMTPEGIRAFANYDVQFTLSRVGFEGYSSINDFMDYLRHYSHPDRSQKDNIMIVSRFRMSEEFITPTIYEPTPPLVNVVRRLFIYKCALRGNMFYFAAHAKEGEVAQAQEQMEYMLKAEFDNFASRNPGFSYEHQGSFIYTPGADVEHFIETIS